MNSSPPYLLPESFEMKNMAPRTPPHLISSDQNRFPDTSTLSTSSLSLDSTQWTPKAIVAEMTSTRRRSEFVIMSPLYRGTVEEEKRDHSVNSVVVDEISASEWRMSRKWKKLVARQIEAEIDEAYAIENEKKVLHLQREVTFLQHLNQQQYFVNLRFLDPSINVKKIRDDIQKKLVEHLRNEVPTSSPPWIPTSSLTSVVVSFSSAKSVLKSIPKFERFQIAVDRILMNKMSITQTARTFDVNRGTLLNRVKSKRLAVIEYDKKCRLLNEAEESALLHFIDRYCKLGFPPKYEMIRDKVMKLRALRIEDPEPIELHWVSRFLNRHSDYKSKFPRHLDQKRHWNTEPKIFENWFNLYQKIMKKFEIVIDDVYNMNEKGHLMRMTGNVKWVLRFLFTDDVVVTSDSSLFWLDNSLILMR